MRHTATNAVVTYLGMGMSLISAPILAQTLGADGRGVLAGTFVVIQVVGWIAFFGLPNGLALQIEKRQELSVWGVVSAIALGFIAGTATFVAAPVLANGDSRIEIGIRAVAGLLTLTGVANIGDQLALLRGQVRTYNLIRISTLVFPSLAIIVLFISGQLTLVTAFFAMLAGQVFALLTGLAVAIRGLAVPGRARIPWGFSTRIWISTVFDSVGGRGDQLALTALTSAPVVGVYAIAVTCANAASGIAQALAQSSITHFVRETQSGEVRPLGRLMLVSAAMTVVSGTAVFVGLVFFGTAVFGEDFASLPPIVAVLVLAGTMQDVWKIRLARESARERAGSLAIASAAGLVAMLAVIAALSLMGAVSGLTMAASFFTMCAVRLGVHIIITRRAEPVSKQIS